MIMLIIECRRVSPKDGVTSYFWSDGIKSRISELIQANIQVLSEQCCEQRLQWFIIYTAPTSIYSRRNAPNDELTASLQALTLIIYLFYQWVY